MAVEGAKVNLINPAELRVFIDKLVDNEDPTNWVLLGYGDGKNDILPVGSGTGGIEELKGKMDPDKILFALVEVTVTGDEYNPIKRIFLTWIGNKVPAGLGKAKSAGHGIELREIIKKDYKLAFSSEFQATTLKEIAYDTIAQSITRMRPSYATSKEVDAERQAMSRARAKPDKTSKLVFVNEAKVVTALQDLFASKCDWVILAYVVGQKDEVELIKTGSGGVAGLQKEFPTDTIYYGFLRQPMETSGRDVVNKFLLVTMIGENVKPLQKARSAGQRQDLTDFSLKFCPYHAQYQPSKKEDLTTKEIDKVLATMK